MSEDYDTYTRVNRFEKRRKNTKAISWLFGLGGFFVILLIGLFVFGGDKDEDRAQGINDSSEGDKETEEQADEIVSEAEQSNNKDQDLGGTEDTNEQGEESIPVNEEVEVESVISDDDNVTEAYTGNWKPVGTGQEGTHEISWDDQSQDWKEMMQAVRLATDLSEDDMIEWWVERDGDQAIKATVSNGAETEIYRVYASWVDNQGWAPTKVEVLEENDQKHRFEDNNAPEDETTENVTE